MPTQEEFDQQLDLLRSYRRTLAHYLKQQAILGESQTRPEVAHGIDEARENIKRIKETLRNWYVDFENLPSDEDDIIYSISSQLLNNKRVNTSLLKILFITILCISGYLLFLVTKERQDQLIQTSVIAPTNTLSPTTQPTLVVSSSITPTQVTTPVLEETPTVIPLPVLDINTLLQIDETWKLCGDKIIPSYINPNLGISIAQEKLLQDFRNGVNDESWQLAPTFYHLYTDLEPEQGVSVIRFKLSSIVPDTRWIEISNKITVTIRAEKIMPQNLNLAQLSQCGAGGQIREFTPVDLSVAFPQYSTQVRYDNADFFTLSPGEIEIFDFKLYCRAPGQYNATIEIPYSYGGVEGTILKTDPFPVICPQEYTYWQLYVDDRDNPTQINLNQERTYVWSGNNYSLSP